MNFKKLNPLRWSKTFLIILLGGFVLIWFTFFDTYSLWTSYQLHRRYKNLKTKTNKLQINTKLLKQKIDSLNNNPALLKRIAREKYGMKKKGETIYKIKVE
jgi:cell division protein FtsB